MMWFPLFDRGEIPLIIHIAGCDWKWLVIRVTTELVKSKAEKRLLVLIMDRVSVSES